MLSTEIKRWNFLNLYGMYADYNRMINFVENMFQYAFGRLLVPPGFLYAEGIFYRMVSAAIFNAW